MHPTEPQRACAADPAIAAPDPPPETPQRHKPDNGPPLSKVARSCRCAGGPLQSWEPKSLKAVAQQFEIQPNSLSQQFNISPAQI
jgi:hypothetical protein